MTAYNIALFLHILGAIGIVGGSALEHVLHARQLRTRTNEQLGEALWLSELLGRLMPLFGLVILVAGLYMTFTTWGFGFAWIDLSLLLLVGIGAAAPLVLDPKIKAVRKLVTAGESIERSHAVLRSPAYVATLNSFTAEAIAIVALMTLKLDWVPALIVVVVAAAIGIAVAFVPTRRPVAKAQSVEVQAARRG